MERNAHYAAVGLATLVLVLGLVLFVVWLARFQFARDFDLYDVRFYGPVRGLQVGGEVHFNGIKVGEVTDLRLMPARPDVVIARVRLRSEVPVRTDSRAQLEPQGITGVTYIQITGGTPANPLLKAGHPEGFVPVIESQPSPIAELLEGGGNVLARTLETLDRANRVLSEENIAAFSNTLANVEAVTAELRARREALAKAEAAIESADRAAQEVAALARSGRSLVEGDGAQAVRRLNAAAGEIEAAAKDVRALTARVEGPAGDFAETGLPQLTAAAASLQETAESLDRLVRETQQSPRGLINRPPPREREVPR